MKPTPIEIELEPGKRLLIRWSEGESSAVSLVRLRQACPCAACRTARSQEERATLPLAAAAPQQADMVAVTDLELVGRYGLRITWKDGHSAGIYGFEKLRELAD